MIRRSDLVGGAVLGLALTAFLWSDLSGDGDGATSSFCLVALTLQTIVALRARREGASIFAAVALVTAAYGGASVVACLGFAYVDFDEWGIGFDMAWRAAALIALLSAMPAVLALGATYAVDMPARLRRRADG